MNINTNYTNKVQGNFYMNTKSNQTQAKVGAGSSDSVTFSLDSQAKSLSKLTEAQKQLLRDKYKFDDLKFGMGHSEQGIDNLMKDLLNMNIITEGDYDSYSKPMWRVVDGANVSCSPTGQDERDIYAVDILTAFRRLTMQQRNEAKLTDGKSKDDFLAASDMYTRLSGILGEIFE